MVGHLLRLVSNGLETEFEAVELEIPRGLSHMQLLPSDWGMNYRKGRMTETWEVAEVLNFLSLRDLEFIFSFDLAEVCRSILIVTGSFNPCTL